MTPFPPPHAGSAPGWEAKAAARAWVTFLEIMAGKLTRVWWPLGLPPPPPLGQLASAGSPVLEGKELRDRVGERAPQGAAPVWSRKGLEPGPGPQRAGPGSALSPPEWAWLHLARCPGSHCEVEASCVLGPLLGPRTPGAPILNFPEQTCLLSVGPTVV